MRIAQLTDPHLPTTRDDTPAGACPHARFEHVLRSVLATRPDLLIITGDVAAEAPDPRIYRYLRQLLSGLEPEPIVLKGNHDRGVDLDAVLAPWWPGSFAVRRAAPDLEILLLDSSQPEPPAGALEELAASLRRAEDGPAALFTHYPPVPVGNPVFDVTESLPWRRELLAVLDGARRPVDVYFGHVHFAHESRRGSTVYRSTPSATRPVQGSSAELPPDEGGGYFRLIDRVPGRRPVTRLVRVPWDRTLDQAPEAAPASPSRQTPA